MNPNLPDLLHTKCRGLKRAASSLSQKLIVRQEHNCDRPTVILSVYLLLASVKPYLAVIQSEECKRVVKSFVAEREAEASAKSTEIPYDVTNNDEELIAEKVMGKVKEFSRLLMMEMKCHITPVFGCFEFFQCSFVLDSDYTVKFRTIESNSMIFTTPKDVKLPKEKPRSLLPSIEEQKGSQKVYNSNTASVFREGMDIVLRLHQIG